MRCAIRANVAWSPFVPIARKVRRVKRQPAILISIAAVLIAISMIAVHRWIATRPAWLLSARNTADGVIVEVHKEHESEATYSTLLEGCSLDHDVWRMNRQDLPEAIGTTTFSDETIPPGRWTVVLGGVRLDIMERALILEDGTEIRPRE